MKLLALAAALFASIVSAQTNVTLSWDYPTTNADGYPLVDLESFKLMGGPSPNQLTNVLAVVTNVITAPLAGSVYTGQFDIPAGIDKSCITVIAVDKSNNSSRISNVILRDSIAPNGGESWCIGTVETISWSSVFGTNVRIDLLSGGVLERGIVGSTAHDGSFDWAIPDNVISASSYRIRVTSIDGALGVTSASDFSIGRLVYAADMSTDPGWTYTGTQWAYGPPQGFGGDDGSPDPTSGFTGPNVVGYNLAGGYANDTPSEFATTPVMDCRGLETVTLQFQRWLGVDSIPRDRASISVSNDGATWSTIWTNPSAVLSDSAWQTNSFDISSVAADQPTVFIRWEMGPTDEITTFCGWNIDDVVVKGIGAGDVTPPTITCPGHQTAECIGVVDYPPPVVSDNQYTYPSVVCVPPSGSIFPAGDTLVTCTATDLAGNAASCTFTVSVVDTTPPDLNCPANITGSTPDQSGAVVHFDIPAADLCDPDPLVVCTPASGSTFPIGTTTVFCTATDADGNSNACSFDVTVNLDTEPPEVTAVDLNTEFSSPPDLPAGPQPSSWELERSDLRSLSVSFSEAMTPLVPADLLLVNLGVNADVDPDVEIPLSAGQLALSPDGTILSILLTPEQLTDGVYKLIVLPSATDLSGNPLDGDGNGIGGDAFVLQGDNQNRLFELTADWSGDGFVDIVDILSWLYWINHQVTPISGAAAPAYMDPSGDSFVDIVDALSWLGKLNQGLVFGAGAPGIISGSPTDIESSVALEYTFTVPGVGEVVPDGLIVLPPGKPVQVKVRVASSRDEVNGYQLNFASSDVSAGEMLLNNFSSSSQFDSPSDVTLNTPGDASVTALKVSPGNNDAPLVLGSFQLTLPETPGAEFLLSIESPPGLQPITRITSGTSTLSIEDYGDVTIRVQSPDGPPTITCPATQLTDCTGPNGAVVDYAAPVVSDDLDANPQVVCVPPSGSLFPLGDSVVACTATDNQGNSSVCQFTVTVVDTTPPAIMCEGLMVVDCGVPIAPEVLGFPVVSDLYDSDPVLTSEDEIEAGDYNNDCRIDRSDLLLLIQRRGTSATGPDDPFDLDGDRSITVQDARRLLLRFKPHLLVTRTWTATDAHGNSSSCEQLIQRGSGTGEVSALPVDAQVRMSNYPVNLKNTDDGLINTLSVEDVEGFTMTLTGPSLGICAVEASQDLGKWSEVGLVLLDETGVLEVLTEVPQGDTWYFRIRLIGAP